MISTLILFIFAALSAGSYGAGGSTQGLFAALAAWRFFVGIGIGLGATSGLKSNEFWLTRSAEVNILQGASLVQSRPAS